MHCVCTCRYPEHPRRMHCVCTCRYPEHPQTNALCLHLQIFRIPTDECTVIAPADIQTPPVKCAVFAPADIQNTPSQMHCVCTCRYSEHPQSNALCLHLQIFRTPPVKCTVFAPADIQNTPRRMHCFCTCRYSEHPQTDPDQRASPAPVHPNQPVSRGNAATGGHAPRHLHQEHVHHRQRRKRQDLSGRGNVHSWSAEGESA